MSSLATKNVVWKDQRSGPVGCLAGNLVLDYIQGDDETFRRLKGNIFVSDDRLIIGRVCSRESYLTGPWVHFTNLTKSHHYSLITESDGKPIYYAFISVKDESIHFWLIPHQEVGNVLKTARIKQSDAACIIRIREDGNKYDMMGLDVTKYHQVMILNPQLTKKFTSVTKAAKQESSKARIRFTDDPKGTLVNLMYDDGREFEGVIPLKDIYVS